MSEQPMTLSRAELEEIVEKTVESTLTKLGVDASNPFEMQKDFAYIRNVRVGSSATRMAVFGAFIASGVAGVGTLLWFGVQWLIHLGHPPG